MIGLKVSPEVKVGQREPAPSNKEKNGFKFKCLKRKEKTGCVLQLLALHHMK